MGSGGTGRLAWLQKPGRGISCVAHDNCCLDGGATLEPGKGEAVCALMLKETDPTPFRLRIVKCVNYRL